MGRPKLRQRIPYYLQCKCPCCLGWKADTCKVVQPTTSSGISIQHLRSVVKLQTFKLSIAASQVLLHVNLLQI